MKIFRVACLIGLFSVLSSGALSATCSGSGTSWSCTSGTTLAQIQTALNSASDGATFTFAGGSYSWSGTWVQFAMSKGATLICASGATCTVSTSGTIFGINGFSGTSTKLYRISGFTFNASANPTGMVWFDACNPGCTGLISNIRLDHNTINISGSGAVIFFFGDNASHAYYYGVIDHNTVNTPSPAALFFWLGDQDPNPPASPQGTANNLFVEDNVFVNASLNDSNVSTPCFSDAWGGASIVMRHNTITNCAVPIHDLTHGGGPQNVEVYNNTFLANSGTSSADLQSGYRMFHHQGAAEEMYFNNTFRPNSEPHDATMLSALAGYVDGACSSYPCSHQPGRDFAGILRPIYAWNNIDSVNNSLVTADNESAGTIVATNRDIYNAASTSANTSKTTPFNGTTGVGFGPLANRPDTCTHSNPTNPTRSPQDDGHGGVGYFATDQGPQGTLYTCTAANTWTVQYVPYTYPHPLTAGSAPVVDPAHTLQAAPR